MNTKKRTRPQFTQEHKDNISRANKGRIMSQDQKGKCFFKKGHEWYRKKDTIKKMKEARAIWWKEQGVIRIKWICPTCQKEETLTEYRRRGRKYCSVKCTPPGEYITGEKRDDSTQRNMHAIMHCRKGYPNTYKCVGDGINPCDKQAYDWSNDDHEYSNNPEEYKPRCRSCHMKYDYVFNNRKRRTFPKNQLQLNTCLT